MNLITLNRDIYLPLMTVSLRLVTAVSRFAFILTASRYLEPIEFGTYGLAVSYIALFIQVLGLEFYIYSQREALSTKDDRSSLLVSVGQMHFSLTSSLLLIPLLSLILISQDFSLRLMSLILLVLAVEYLSTELSRILIFRLRPLAATFLTFIRNGIWPILAIYLLVADFEGSQSAAVYLGLGAVGGLLAAGVGVALIFGGQASILWREKMEFPWFKQGFVQVRPFILAALAFKLLELQDRFFLEYFHGLEAFGGYFLLVTLAGGVQLVLNTAVSQIWGPRTIRGYRTGDWDAYATNRRHWIIAQLIFGTFTITCAALLIGPALNLIGQAAYIEELDVFYVLLVVQVLLVFAEYWQMELYCRGLDRWMPISAMVAVVVGAIGNYLLVPEYANIGAALATSIGILVLGLTRMLGFLVDRHSVEFRSD